MKIYYKLLIVLIFLISENPAMAQLNILIKKNNESSFYLTNVDKSEYHIFFNEHGESDICIYYYLREDDNNGLGQRKKWIYAHFIPLSNGRYKIMETYLSTSYYSKEFVGKRKHTYIDEKGKKITEYEFSPWKESIFESPPNGDELFVGYSDDSTLLAVKALNYANKHTVEPLYYIENEVSQPAEFYNAEQFALKNDTEETINECLKQTVSDPNLINKIPIDSISGNIYLSYGISTLGKLIDFKVESVKINHPQYVSYICSTTNYILYKITWKPALLNGVSVSVRRNFTINFINGKRM